MVWDSRLAGQSLSQSRGPDYALRLFTYDYYEWEEVHAVSFDPKLLRAHFEGLDHLYANRPLVDGSEHSAHADREDAHWTIEPVNFLHNDERVHPYQRRRTSITEFGL